MHLVVLIVLQVLTIGHCIYTRQDRVWLWMLLLLPGAGALAYLIAVVVPDMLGGRTSSRVARQVKKSINPLGETRRREDQLALSDSVDARRRLAEEHLENGRFAEAEKLFAEALNGIYEFEPNLMFARAQSLFGLERNEETIALLDDLIARNPDFRNQYAHLLYARAQEALGNEEKALEEYKALAEYFAGAEAKVRYGLLLKKTGAGQEATRLFAEVLANARLAPRHFQKTNRKWLAIARKEGGV